MKAIGFAIVIALSWLSPAFAQVQDPHDALMDKCVMNGPIWVWTWADDGVVKCRGKNGRDVVLLNKDGSLGALDHDAPRKTTPLVLPHCPAGYTLLTYPSTSIPVCATGLREPE